ncbi:MAG: hypothetical protein JST11_12175 [Acidobacteria bacterium]|nr:hypothetical protein [Acidobacteriota bacterium]
MAAMRDSLSGFALGVMVAIAVMKVAPSTVQPSAKGTPAAAPPHGSAVEPICGRDTFNIAVGVPRIFPGLGPNDPDPFAAATERRLDAYTDGLEDRLSQAGLNNDPACPILLSVFGMVHESAPDQWVVTVHVQTEYLHKDERVVYPSWDSGEYRASYRRLEDAQEDMMKTLTERVERFIRFFGKRER